MLHSSAFEQSGNELQPKTCQFTKKSRL